VPALPSSVLEPLWVQIAALLPTRQDTHPLGCHRPRIPDRIVFDKLIQVLVFGCGYRRIADHTCFATTLRRRRDEWIALGLAERVRLAVRSATASARRRPRRAGVRRSWRWQPRGRRDQDGAVPARRPPHVPDCN
jgi:hypothetical protein